MKKIIKVTFLSVITLIVGYNVYRTQLVKPISKLILANIESLAQEEHFKCDNSNGYRRILSGEERIYDCCNKEQTGKGKEDCKRW